MVVEPKLYKIRNVFAKPISPEIIKDAEKLHKRISTLREEDLFKPFTI
jgi:hypothetical protein